MAGMILSSSRAIRTTPEILFEAVANPKHLVEWWGQKGLTHKIDKFEFKSGGAWTMTSHAADGKHFPQESEFLDIAKPNRVVFQHNLPRPKFHLTMTFEKISDQTTKLAWVMQFPPSPDNETFKPLVEVAIAKNLDRLEVYLPKIKL